MPCIDETWENNIRYYKFDDIWFVGDNVTTNVANAVKSTSDVSGILTIPRTVKCIDVKEIGQWACFSMRLCYLNCY